MSDFATDGPPVQPALAGDDPDDDPLRLPDSEVVGPSATANQKARKPAGERARPRFVSTVTAAAMLGVTIGTVRRMIADGRLRAVKWGAASQSRWRVPVEEIDQLGDAPPPSGDL